MRESPLPHGAGCRWVTYWEGTSGWALVALCRESGAITPNHAHPPGRRLRTAVDPLELVVGATFEGDLEIDDRPGQGGDGAAAGRPPEVAVAS